MSEIREDTERVSKELADTNSRVSDLEENTNTDVSQSSEGQSSPDESRGQTVSQRLSNKSLDFQMMWR